MEWKVTNALNRDVERQQLNKILAEIRAATNKPAPSTGTPAGNVKGLVGEMVSGNEEAGVTVTYNPSKEVLDFAVSTFTISLIGDVTGSVEIDGLRSGVLQTSIDQDLLGIPEAPVDDRQYTRGQQTWNSVSSALEDLSRLKATGFIQQTVDGALDDDPDYSVRVFDAVAGETVVINPDGSGGNVSYGLADLANSGVGVSPVQLITRDSKGRVEGTEDASTDDLPEGLANLYFTEERAQDATGAILASTADIELAYDDDVPSITATIVNSNLASIAALVPADGDIMEYNGTASEWAATKSPRELYLDGGNF